MNRVVRAAIHEAGHVVVADTLGVPTVRAHVANDGSGLCVLEMPDDSDAVLNWDVAITLAGAIAAARAAREDWRDLDLRAVLDQEGSEYSRRCDRMGYAYRKAVVLHSRAGASWPRATDNALRWVDTEPKMAAALAADILDRRWHDVCDFAEKLVLDMADRDAFDYEPVRPGV
jgi:hypothetical protein